MASNLKLSNSFRSSPLLFISIYLVATEVSIIFSSLLLSLLAVVGKGAGGDSTFILGIPTMSATPRSVCVPTLTTDLAFIFANSMIACRFP
jgi:hypothetical protein